MYVFSQEDCATVTKANQFLVLRASIFSLRCENSNSVFMGQTNYRDKLGRDY